MPVSSPPAGSRPTSARRRSRDSFTQRGDRHRSCSPPAVVPVALPAVLRAQGVRTVVIVDWDFNRYGDFIAAAQDGLLEVLFCSTAKAALELSAQAVADAWFLRADLPDLSGFRLRDRLSEGLSAAPAACPGAASEPVAGAGRSRPLFFVVSESSVTQEEVRALRAGAGYLVRAARSQPASTDGLGSRLIDSFASVSRLRRDTGSQETQRRRAVRRCHGRTASCEPSTRLHAGSGIHRRSRFRRRGSDLETSLQNLGRGPVLRAVRPSRRGRTKATCGMGAGNGASARRQAKRCSTSDVARMRTERRRNPRP
jgi:hypothetical protein